MKTQNLCFYDLVTVLSKLIEASTFEDAVQDLAQLTQIKEYVAAKPAAKRIPLYWGVGKEGSVLTDDNSNWGNWCHKVYEIKCDENMMWSIQEVGKGTSQH